MSYKDKKREQQNLLKKQPGIYKVTSDFKVPFDFNKQEADKILSDEFDTDTIQETKQDIQNKQENLDEVPFDENITDTLQEAKQDIKNKQENLGEIPFDENLTDTSQEAKKDTQIKKENLDEVPFDEYKEDTHFLDIENSLLAKPTASYDKEEHNKREQNVMLRTTKKEDLVEETDRANSTEDYDDIEAKEASKKLAQKIINKHERGDHTPTPITDLFKAIHVVSSLKHIRPNIKVNVRFKSNFADIQERLLGNKNGEKAFINFINDISKADSITFMTEASKDQFLKAASEHGLRINSDKIKVNNSSLSKVKGLAGQAMNEVKKSSPKIPSQVQRRNTGKDSSLRLRR